MIGNIFTFFHPHFQLVQPLSSDFANWQQSVPCDAGQYTNIHKTQNLILENFKKHKIYQNF